ncbi:hypothetical protein KXD40_000247 [Peronospora effusa]|nr:hypothetical protein KXD40_000247 [Peronospora effusa]
MSLLIPSVIDAIWSANKEGYIKLPIGRKIGTCSGSSSSQSPSDGPAHSLAEWRPWGIMTALKQMNELNSES